MALEKSRWKEVSMNACNHMSATARKVTLLQKVRNRKNFLNDSKTQAVASVVHQTNNSSPLKHRPAQIPRYLNTYRLESKNGFSCDLVYGVLEDVVYNQCFGVPYDSEKCGIKVQTMAGEIMRRVKKFEFDRYRLIVFVEIGSNRNQEFDTSVKFLWDASKDKFATYNLSSGSMFTSATCFGIYQD